MSVVIDSYSESNYSAAIDGLGAGYLEKLGESFTSQLSILEQIKWYMLKGGSPTGNVYAKIYKHTGTYGSTDLAYNAALAVSDAVDVSTVGAGIGLISFTFSAANRIVLNDPYYVVTAEYDGGDASNYLALGIDNSSPTHDGAPVDWVSGDWATADTSKDRIFYVYGTLIDAWGPYPTVL